jgi:hypothetical protein
MSLLDTSEKLLNELVERIHSDFELVLPDLHLRFITYAAWVADDPRVVATPVDDDIVCVTDRSSFPIHAYEGVEVSCCLVADQLQDIVIDDFWRPWPALNVEGSLLVPIPELDAWGKACWQVEGRFRCPVGYLRQALRIFGAID